jgi:hypothetical protein
MMNSGQAALSPLVARTEWQLSSKVEPAGAKYDQHQWDP